MTSLPPSIPLFLPKATFNTSPLPHMLTVTKGTNTYLILPSKSSTCLLLDTGQGSDFPSWRRSIQKVLASESARLGKAVRITQCVLSHWHHDHVGGIKELRDLCGEFEQGKEGKEDDVERKKGAEQTDLKIYKYPLYDTSPNLPNAETRSREREVQLLTSANNDQDVGFLHDLHDGQTLSIGSTEAPLELRVLHTPGHTVDHVALVITSSPSDPTELGTIFTGDAVLGYGTAVFEDLGMYMMSLSKMKDTIQGYDVGEKEAVKAFPGHGAVIPNAGAKIDEYISHRAMRQREVFDVLNLDLKQPVGSGRARSDARMSTRRRWLVGPRCR